MKIFGEELGSTGRYYVLLPPLLLIGFLVGLFFLAGASQTKLNAASQRVHDSLLRQQALTEYVALVTDAESAQRGYLLTGETAYLNPYRESASKIPPALERVHQAYGGGDGGEFRALRLLTGKKLGELEDSVALYPKKSAITSASVGTDVGKHTMDELLNVAGAMRVAEETRLSAATRAWQSDFQLSRITLAAGAVLTLVLVLLTTHLVYADMRRRAQQATGLRDQKLELEQQVQARTQELATLSTHLQGVSEQEKATLSRELHDELGGLLVAARMDVSWLQQRINLDDAAIEHRFKRIHESLSAGVDLKRRVVEELRPTLLDNMGLFAALRWQFKESCRRAGLQCTENVPESELRFTPDVAIGLFRVAQEAMTNIIKHAGARSADLSVGIYDEVFTMRISDDGKGLGAERSSQSGSHGLVAMRHRLAVLGGRFDVRSVGAKGTVVTATIPLAQILETTY
jgi:signal transduction histidine kinase